MLNSPSGAIGLDAGARWEDAAQIAGIQPLEVEGKSVFFG